MSIDFEKAYLAFFRLFNHERSIIQLKRFENIVWRFLEFGDNEQHDVLTILEYLAMFGEAPKSFDELKLHMEEIYSKRHVN